MLKNQPVKERRLLMASGAEGPSHDPYHWDEYTMVFNGNRITLRQGALGYNRLTVTRGDPKRPPMIRIEDHAERENQSKAVQRFEAMTQMTIGQFVRCYQRIYPMGESYADPYGPLSRYE